eukprot:gnl/Dysnectes_brevis/660_a728_6160.p1 GENE.gnl/Dysnectes_brevis/660_a728_6160~~gnl/Dysnectes_brevis/660_a728_6160.p1  ORF type:complete len:314 (-),score=121.77 gnl/Dysnectes_brevis/660_a728_6160:57-998(-)
MKLLAFALLVAVVLCDRAAFARHKEFYGKTYATDAEHERRFQIFKENMRTAALLERLDSTGVYGDSPFMDLTEDEFSAKYLRAMEPPLRRTTAVNIADAPDAWDWDHKGYVQEVKDQGQCGSCWAFSVVGGSESAYAIKTGNLLNGAEQQLVDCDTQDSACDGGNLDYAYSYVETYGIMPTSSYRYTSGKTAKPTTCKYDSSNIAITVASHTDLPEGDEDSMANALYANGPVSIALNATPLQFYSSGIMNPSWCSPRRIDHGVLLVGYGSENNTPYWRIKNSWGASWGEEGYFRLIRGSNACGVAEWAVVAHA